MGLTGAAHAEQKVVAGYFADWQYANAENPYTVNDIPADKLTHVIYAFLGMCGPHAGASETVQKLVAEQCEGKDPYTAIIVDTLGAFLGQNVAFEGLLVLDAISSFFETFCRTADRFNLRHYSISTHSFVMRQPESTKPTLPLR